MAKFDPATARPAQIEAYLSDVIRQLWGDSVQNNANVFATHGYWSINIPRPNDYTITFSNFRKSRIPEIVANLKFLAKRK